MLGFGRIVLHLPVPFLTRRQISESRDFPLVFWTNRFKDLPQSRKSAPNRLNDPQSIIERFRVRTYVRTYVL